MLLWQLIWKFCINKLIRLRICCEIHLIQSNLDSQPGGTWLGLMAVFSPRTKWSLYSITRTESNTPVLTLTASVTQHPAVPHFTKIHIQIFYMIPFMDQSPCFQRIQRSQLLNQTPISAKEPQVNDPVPHLDSSLFSSGVGGWMLNLHRKLSEHDEC